MSKYNFLGLVIATLTMLLPATASAGVFDGSKPLLCAVLHAAECGAEVQKCRSGAPWELNIPVFIELDFAGQTASTTSQHATERTSAIEQVSHLAEQRMSVQGVDGEFGWSMLISEETGSMTLSVAGEEVGFVVFGACTVDR